MIFFALKLMLETLIPVKAVSYINAYKNVDWIGTAWHNLFYYANVWKELFKDATALGNIDGIVAGICLFFALAGISINRKENLLYIVFSACYLGILILTPFYQGLRYLIPLVPIFFFFMVQGVFYIAGALYAKRGNLAAWTFVLALAGLTVSGTATLSYFNVKTPYIMDGPYTPGAASLFGFLKKSTPQGSIIGYWKPRVMLLYSGRNGILAQDYNDCMVRKADYYVHYDKAYADQLPLDSITLHPGRFKSVFENKGFRVFKVLRDTSQNATLDKEQVPPNAGELVKTIDHTYFKPAAVSGPEKLIGVWSNSRIDSKPFRLQKGRYLVSVYCKGTKAANVFPLNRVSINNKTLGVFYSLQQAGRKDLLFEMENDGEAILGLKLENDLAENGEDRNTLVYFIAVYKAN